MKKVTATNHSLYSPFIDFMLAGGVGVIILPLLFVVFPVSQDGTVDGYTEYYVSVSFAVLAYLVNNPHFIASYQLVYEGFGEKLAAQKQNPATYWRYINAGIIVPVLLILYLLYAFIAQDQAIFAIGVEIMFFFVGWHYVKQAFGVLVVLSALKKLYYFPAIRKLLLINAFLVWMLSWLSGNIWVPGLGGDGYDFHGVSYDSLKILLPAYVITLLEYVVIFYGIIIGLAIMWQSYKARIIPPLSALAGYSSMYTLLLLSYYHPLWVYMTPLLHSAQYLLFVSAYKKGEMACLSEEYGADVMERKNKNFILISFLLGIVFFTTLPQSLEGLLSQDNIEGSMFLPFMYAFMIFINIHHYFIDNVIWRKENEHVGRYLGAVAASSS